MAVEITDVYNGDDTTSSEHVRKYYAALLQWNLSSSNVHCPSLKYWVPSGQCWMTSWPCTHQMYLLQRDLCGKYTPFRFGLHGKSGSMKKQQSSWFPHEKSSDFKDFISTMAIIKKLLFRGNFFLCSSKEALKYWVPSFWFVRNAHQYF